MLLVTRETKFRENRDIAFNMLQTINQLQPGAKAPDFAANDKTNQVVNLYSYKGKHVYLNFFLVKAKTAKKKCRKLLI